MSSLSSRLLREMSLCTILLACKCITPSTSWENSSRAEIFTVISGDLNQTSRDWGQSDRLINVDLITISLLKTYDKNVYRIIIKNYN